GVVGVHDGEATGVGGEPAAEGGGVGAHGEVVEAIGIAHLPGPEVLGGYRVLLFAIGEESGGVAGGGQVQLGLPRRAQHVCGKVRDVAAGIRGGDHRTADKQVVLQVRIVVLRHRTRAISPTVEVEGRGCA